MTIELKNKNLIKKFVSHDTPVEIYFDDSEYSEAESKKLQAQFILTLCGFDYKTV